MSANAIEAKRVNVPLVVIGTVVAVASFGAAVLVGQVSGRPAGTPAATQAVLVAARDVPSRQGLAAADLPGPQYAPADVPPAALGEARGPIGPGAPTPPPRGPPGPSTPAR